MKTASVLLLSALGVVAAEPSQWCAVESNTTTTTTTGEFRGRFRDFSLYVVDGADACKHSLGAHRSGDDGLWVLEFDTPAKFYAALQKTKSAGITTLLEDTTALTLVVQGGEDVPDKTNLDACGGEVGVSVIPVASRKVTYPKKSNLEGVELSLARADTTIAKAVKAVSRSHLEESVRHLSEEFFTRNSYSTDVRGAQNWLEERYTEMGLKVHTHEFRSDMPHVVVAEHTGTKYPEEYIVVGAHYDSRSTNNSSPTQEAPGADDNASGTSALLELARLLQDHKINTEYSIRLCSFSGEEQGLLGSKALAEHWKKENLNIKVMFNADMLGWQIPNEEITLGFKDRSISVEDTEMVMKITKEYVPALPKMGYSSSCCSDYMSFYDNGWPSVGFFENDVGASSYPYYHTSNDKLEYVNTKQLHLEVQAIVASTLTYANAHK